MLKNITKLLQHNPRHHYATAAAPAMKPKTKTKVSPSPSASKPLITCKRTEFNLLVPAKMHSKFGEIPLASKGWMHDKSKNDFFMINPTVSEEDLLSDMLSLEQFLENSSMPLLPELVGNLKNELDIDRFTGIQTSGMPSIYDGQHTLIAAETGCGKTLTYLLPMVQKILTLKQTGSPQYNERKLNSPLAIIITPGRELATQIADVAEKLCKSTDIKVKALLGGNTKRLMVHPEFEDIDILVATIGALSKLVTTGIYRMNRVQNVVLDEADTLLDDSFNDKLCHFLKKFPFHKNSSADGTQSSIGTQMVLASATMPTNIAEMLHKVIDVETLHEVVSPNLHRLMPHVQQKFLRMTKSSRPATLLSIVKTELSKKRPLIIFSNKSATCDFVNIFLNNNGVNSLNLNGDMLMKIRVGRFEQYQRGECDVLSTTDVGSRGLDTQRARHVINFDFPLHISDYIHRCGRIGRVGNVQKCLVTNFISSRREVNVVQRIEHAARTNSLLPNVNANIRGVINKQIMNDMKIAGTPAQEEAF